MAEQDLSIDKSNIDEVEQDESKSAAPERLMSPQDASTIKSQLFELCKQGDIDKNELIDFDEFTSVIAKFLPNTTETRMREMFNTLDANGDGNISYSEFLTDSNFNKFLKYC